MTQIYSQELSQILVTNAPDVIHGTAGTDSAGGAHDGVHVLVVSSAVQSADQLVQAAADGVLTVLYNAKTDTPDNILSKIETTLAGQKADSIAFAAHDQGAGQFFLTKEFTVNVNSLTGSADLQHFWPGVGSLVKDNGRIDLLACGLVSSEAGNLLLSQLEALTGKNFAASDDPTGNPQSGGDWVLESDGVNVAPVYFSQAGLSQFTGVLENAAPTAITLSDNSVNENLPSGTVVGTLSTEDPDAGDTHIYSLVAGDVPNDNASFTIDGNTLKTASSFDYEANHTYQIAVRTTDQSLAYYEQEFTINVAGVNEAPTATSQSATTIEDTPKVITLDVADVDSDPVAVTVTNAPAHGGLTFNGLNVTYTPTLNYNGEDSFTYKAYDGNADSDVATVSVTVNPVNDAPVVDAQSVSVNEDGTLTITVTGTDVDNPDAPYVSFEISAPVTHGTLVPVGPVVLASTAHYSQQFLYAPDSNYNAPDSFQFKMTSPVDGTLSGFSSSSQIGTDTDQTSSITLGDVNGDGKLDVVAGNYGQTNKVYIGNGDGTFSSGIAIGPEDYTFAIGLGDVNGDGKLDVVAGNWGTNKVYIGNGDGTFSSGDRD